ncbi:hypothetical protein MICRO80W_70029 [Micrococcus luteus]|nr:hypothetical protein MICRO80W_70029 [Micrococcus luteus]
MAGSIPPAHPGERFRQEGSAEDVLGFWTGLFGWLSVPQYAPARSGLGVDTWSPPRPFLRCLTAV